MISVDEALQRVVAAFSPVACETVPIARAAGRVLAEDVTARLNQPPFPVSAMDGYAARAADVASVPIELTVIGSAPAGQPFASEVREGEAVRIFTGGVVPRGADTIVIQENTDQGHPRVTVHAASPAGKHIRPAAQDFHHGDVLVKTGRRLTARDLALIAAGDVPEITVTKRPRVLVAATGDELSRPGEPRKPGGIVASSVYGLCALIEQWGGAPRDIGILRDEMESIAHIAETAADADLIVTLGGASVGDHDLIQRALGPRGFVLDFWKIALRPGKPLIFGRLGITPLLGLPGNPVSAYVCALLFLKPALAALLGANTESETLTARLGAPMAANDSRQDYVRARTFHRSGELWAEPFQVQDSSMQKALAEADVLIIRPPHAPTTPEGNTVSVIRLE
jgi:molybdopterin molybdotransferase